MNEVSFYKTKNGQWRWKCSYNGNVRCRSENAHKQLGEAKRSFAGFAKGVAKGNYKVTVEA